MKHTTQHTLHLTGTRTFTIMKKIPLKGLFFRLSHVRSSGTTVFCRVDFSPAKITTAQNRAFETSWASVSLPGATAGASWKGWMFLLANSSIINGDFQSFSSPTGILLLSAFLSLSSKSLAKYLRSNPQGIEESHVDFHSAWHGRVYSKMVKNNFQMLLLTPTAHAFSAWQIPNSASVNLNSLFSLRQIGASSVLVTQVECF